MVQVAKRPKTTGSQPAPTFHLHCVLEGREKPSPTLCAITVAQSHPSRAHPGRPPGSRCLVSSVRWFSLAKPRFTTGSFLACLRHAFTGGLTIGAVKSAMPSRRLERHKPVVQVAKRPKTTGTQPTSTFHLHRVLEGREKPSPALCAIVVAQSCPSRTTSRAPPWVAVFRLVDPVVLARRASLHHRLFLACLRHAFTGDLTIDAVKSAKPIPG